MADETQARVDSGIIEMWRKDGRVYFIAGILLGVILFLVLSTINEIGDLRELLEGFAPEAIGIFITVGIIDRRIRKRDAKNAEEALKAQLVMDAGSTSNEKAKDAVHQLRRKGWLEGKDGLLQGVNLDGANLQGAEMTGANLTGANLGGANLQNAVLGFAILRETNLTSADLRGANMIFADLYEASLAAAQLQGADLTDANLADADLHNLWFLDDPFSRHMAEFDERTRLPDGNFWSKEADIECFINPKHPNFYRSEISASPAYRGWD